MKNNTKNLWKGITAILFATIMIASVSVCEGNGTSENPYQITNCTALQNMKNDLSANYILMNDIDCTYDTQDSNGALYNGGQGFAPIGTFTGTFDGQNHIITGLYINRPSTNDIGLFGYVTNEVKNVGLVDVDITGYDFVGGLAGRNEGAISNSYSTGSVSGHSYVGGLVGYNYYATVSDSYSTGSVNGDKYVGGLVGMVRKGSGVSNSYSTASVEGRENVGGLAGHSYQGRIDNSYSTGSVTGSSYGVGGLVGYGYHPEIYNSYSTGKVTGGVSWSVGGLLAVKAGGGTVSNSYYDKDTSGQTRSAGGTGKTTAEMKDPETYVGWDPLIWNLISGQYPGLAWQVPPCTDDDGDGFKGTPYGPNCNEDCDDTNALIHPGATEICDGVDNDCNDLIDDGIADIETDVYGYDDVGECKIRIESCIEGSFQVIQEVIGPSTEVCDNLDNDCDDQIDEDWVCDTEAPVTTISLSGTPGENDWYTSDVIVTLSAFDPETGKYHSGVDYIKYSLNDEIWVTYTVPFTVTESKTVYAYAVDNIGNIEGIESEFTKIDKSIPTAPIIAHLLEFDGDGNYYVSWSGADDAESGIWKYDVYRDTVLYKSGITETSIYESGIAHGVSHTYYVKVYNFAGLTSSSGTETTTIDLFPPTVPDLTPLPQYTTELSIAVDWTESIDVPAGVDYYTLYKNAAELTTTSAAVTEYTDTAVSEAGTYTYQVDSTDKAVLPSHTSAKSDAKSTIIDTLPPTTTAVLEGVDANANGIYESAVTVKLTATDATSDVAVTKYSIDRGAYLDYVGGNGGFLVEGSGTHTVRFYSIDNAGNTEDEKEITIKIFLDTDFDGYATDADIEIRDCDDTDSNVNPGATEVCNGIDDDCDGTIDQISCDDANPCTTDDVCTAGVCAGTLICAGTDTSCGCEECIDCDAQDGWYDTGPTKWVDDLGNFCEEKEQKEQEYRDYSCSGYECVYTVTGTQWVDTDETRNKPDGTPCDDADPCTSNDVCTAGVCSGTQVVIGPKDLKEQAVADLEAAKTGDKKTDKKIDDAIKHIQKSRDDKLWVDELHLDTKHGKEVFDEEKKAVKDIKKLCKCKGIEDMTLEYTGTSTVDIRAYDKGDTMIAEVLGASNGDTIFIDGTTLAKGKLGTETTVKIFDSGTETVIDTQKIHTSCSKPLDEGMTFGDLEVIEVSKIVDLEDCPTSDIIKKIVQADEGLAKTAIDDAKATTVTDPKKQDKVDKEIAKAEEELVKAEDELNKGKPDKAIDHYKKAWEHAQKAIEHAQK